MAKATNIVGENHKPYVSKQIQTRQEVLGNSLRNNEELVWANGRTSWIRVISSVDVKDQQIPLFDDNAIAKGTISNNGAETKLKELGIPEYPAGSALAKDLTLFAGTSKSSVNNVTNGEGEINGYNLNTFLRYGLASSNSILPGLSTSYGLGGTEFGLNAMPGILSFSTENLNKGALRISRVQIKANNKKQFEYLETLYMRLGYTVFIEWGNSSYFIQNSNGNRSYISGIDAQRSLAADFIKANPKDKDENDTLLDYFYQKIEQYRKESQGNYDALVGKVRNFKWNFNSDGTYTIDLELVSYGDVIESLSISELLLDTKLNTDPVTQTQGLKINNVVTPINSSLEAFITIASELPNSAYDKNVTQRVNNTQVSGGSSYKFSGKQRNTSIKSYPSLKEINNNTKEIVDEINYDRTTTPSKDKTILGIGLFGESLTEHRFIRFGDILDFLNQKCLIYDESGKNLIKIDTNPDTNLGYSAKFNLSADPTRVMVRNKFKFPLQFQEDFQVGVFSDKTTDTLEQFHFPLNEEKGQWYCKIMNLYFNNEFLLKTLESYLNEEEQKLNLFEFIKTLLTAANQCLGSVNKFNLRLSDENILQIYDEVRFVGYEEFLNEPNESYPLHVYGFTPSGSLSNSSNEGNFVTDLSISSELSKDFSTLVSIGAQSRGTAVGEDATFFSKWNVGLVDRIIPQKLDWNSLINQENNQRAQLAELVKNYIFFLKSYTPKNFAYIWDSSLAPDGSIEQLKQTADNELTFIKFDLDSVGKYLKVQRDFFKYFLSYDAQQNETINPTVGFLPINISLTMDGISGVRIFDTLKLDTRFLPKNYQNSLDFIIRTVSHEIGLDNKWNTKLQTFAVPKTKGKNQAKITTSKALSTILESVVQPPNEIPNYFYSNNPIILDYYSTIGNYVATSNGYREVELDAILYALNSSSYVQNKYREFFTRIKNELGGGQGFEIQINSAYRPLGRNKSAGGVKNSAHITGLAIDLQINVARPSGVLNRTGTSQTYLSNKKGTKESWEATNIPSIAQELGITWGGAYNYKVGGMLDMVHFAIDGTEKGSPSNQNAVYNYVYIDNAQWNNSILKLNGIPTTDNINIVSYNSFSSKWYAQLEKAIPNISTRLSNTTPIKQLLPLQVYQADGLNTKDYIRVIENNGKVYLATNSNFLSTGFTWGGQINDLKYFPNSKYGFE